MKAITLHRPWDQAILHGTKRIENRSWKLPSWLIGQPVALHAGKKYDHDGAASMSARGFSPPLSISSPTGIVGVVEFGQSIGPRDPEAADPWFVGPVGWHIRDVLALPSPIPCRGAQGLWNVPPGIVDAIIQQVKENDHG